MAKRQQTIEDEQLCETVRLSTEFFEKKENRVLTLLLKGLIVYLLSMGSIGFYLTAFDIAFNVGLCHVIILGMSFFCAMLYYRLMTENLGYLILFIGFAFLAYTFRDYINSGFYAIVNISIENASQYFDVDVSREYTERIGDRYATVTIVAVFIGIVLDILLNVYISRRMQYMTAIFLIMSLNLIPLYLENEPDTLYEIMMLAGVSMAVVFKAGRHYSPQVSAKRNSAKFRVQGKKKREIAYVYDIRAMLQAGALAALLALIVVMTVGTIRPKENFNVGYTENQYKKLTTSAMATLLVDGLEGFYPRGGSNGGVGGGKLGTTSTIYLDNQTDLIVKLAPYTAERIYLKTYTGIRYNPYVNQWTSISDMDGYDDLDSDAEATALAEAYEAGQTNSAKATMEIRCVGVPLAHYMPYYTAGDYEETKTGGYVQTYYPRMSGNETSVSYTSEAYTDEDLYVPEVNLAAVSEAADAIGTIGTTEEVIENLKAYFEENYPYTIRPGRTPNGEDFVNYFLTDNKKGYCSYFASAAVLIFRYMGIPARYVEGYAIDYEQILSGELVEDVDYADVYDGYSEIGATGYVEVNVTDADAHAWVEVYDPVRGWYPVEVTPSSSEEEDVTNFWEEFADFMDDGDEGADTVTNNDNAFTVSDTLLTKILYGLVGAAALALLVLFGRKLVLLVLYRIRFARASYSDRLIMAYSRMVRAYERKHAGFAACRNYESQIRYLEAQACESACIVHNAESASMAEMRGDAHTVLGTERKNTKPKDEEIQSVENLKSAEGVKSKNCPTLSAESAETVRILNEAGFSDREITEQMYKAAVEYVRGLMKREK